MLAAGAVLHPVVRQEWRVDKAVTARIEAAAGQLGVSSLHFWLGVFGLYFHRTTSQEAVCIGIPVLNRSGRKLSLIPL